MFAKMTKASTITRFFINALIFLLEAIRTIYLKCITKKSIEVIKAICDIMQKGLKEAKDFVDSVAKEPQTVKEKAKKEEAEEIKKKLEAAGAKIELK